MSVDMERRSFASDLVHAAMLIRGAVQMTDGIPLEIQQRLRLIVTDVEEIAALIHHITRRDRPEA